MEFAVDCIDRNRGIGTRQDWRRQILRRATCAVMALLSASQFPGCGGDSGLSDAERVERSPGHQMQVTLNEAVDQLKQSGGTLVTKTYPLGEAWAVSLSGATITDATFEQLKTLGRIAELDLSKTNLTDAHMPRLAQAAGVCFKLDLSGTAISDTGLEPLAELPLLTELNLKGTKVTAGAAMKFQESRRNNPKVRDFAKHGQKVTL